MTRVRWAATAVAVVAAGAAAACGGDDGGAEMTTPPEPTFDLVVLGDSFVEHSRDQIRAYAEGEGLTVEVMGLGGTHICDWHDKLAELADDPPAAMVISFAGNDIPDSCFNPTGESRDAATVAAGYREDLTEVIDQFARAGTPLYAVLPPPIRDTRFEERAAAMRVMYREVADEDRDLHLIDAAEGLDPQGVGFAETLPCEEWDECPASGDVVVRDDDGIHLAPAGAERYARTIVDTVS